MEIKEKWHSSRINNSNTSNHSKEEDSNNKISNNVSEKSQLQLLKGRFVKLKMFMLELQDSQLRINQCQRKETTNLPDK